MSKKEDDDFAAWQAEFTKEFASDPDALAAWETLNGKAADKVRDKFYRGTLRQEEFHRRLNETNTEKKAAMEARNAAESLVQQSQEWYAMSKPEYERAVRRAEVLAKLVQDAGLVGNPGEQAPTPQERQSMSGHTSEEIEQMKAALREMQAQSAAVSRGLPNYLRDLAVVQTDILKNNWGVDPTVVMDYSSTRGVTLQQALADLTVEERQTRDQENRKKEIAAGVEEELRKRMASLPTPDFSRGGPRQSFSDLQKEIDAVSNRDSRREMGVALVRDALIGK